MLKLTSRVLLGTARLAARPSSACVHLHPPRLTPTPSSVVVSPRPLLFCAQRFQHYSSGDDAFEDRYGGDSDRYPNRRDRYGDRDNDWGDDKYGGDRYGGGRRDRYGGGGDRYGDGGGGGRSGGGLGASLRKRQWDQVKLVDVTSDVYQPSAAASERSDQEVAEFLGQHDISLVRGQDVPKPTLHFDEVGFPPEIVKHLTERHGFERPMPIQAQGWPIAMSGRDFVGIGQTGSGKTLGYLLPALMHICSQPPVSQGEGPVVLVVAPTRELAQQIQTVAGEYGGVLRQRTRTACLFGGADKGPQIRKLRSGVELVVGTPGRIIDLLEMQCLSLERCSYMVLDEADRMLDMGFEPQIRKVLDQVRPDRQMLMWSATWPEEVRDLAEDFFTKDDYVHLNIGSTELAANHNIKQIVKVVRPNEKMPYLNDYLAGVFEQNRDDKLLIFAETKRQVDMLEYSLTRQGYAASGIHGNKSQMQRDRVLRDFRSGRKNVLVATNVAARGLDVNDVKYVINYDYPNDVEDYVHRIGRTGRQNKTGTSYTFVTEDNAGKQARQLIKVLEEAGQEVEPDLEQLARSNLGKKSAGKGNSSRYRRKGDFNRFSHRDDWNARGQGSYGNRGYAEKRDRAYGQTRQYGSFDEEF